jgi:hypothetical protein
VGCNKKYFIFSLLISSIFAGNVVADDFHILVNSTPTKGNGIFDTFKHGDRVAVNLTVDHSYCCSVFSPFNQITNSATDAGHPVINSISNSNGSVSIPFQKNSAITPAISFGDRSARACFTTNETQGFAIRTAPFFLNIGVPNGTVNDLNVRCDDTTLEGGYNTFASDFVFLEIMNKSETDNSELSPRVMTVTGLAQDGFTTVFQIQVAVAKRADVNLHSLIGPNKIGSIRINHTAPKDTVVAYVAEYKSDPGTKSGLTLLGRQLLLSQ